MPDTADVPIIDAHHHYWDPVANYHPWLRDEPMIPFRYGDYSAIRGRFLPDDYAALTGKFNVIATVTMEGEFDEENLVAESAWMQSLSDQTGGKPAAHVARAFLHLQDAPDVLAGHAQFPIVRGIRHKPTAAPSRDAIETGASGAMSDSRWQDGYRRLSEHGFHFELQAPWWHVDELMLLIEKFPETPVVINHCFMPVDRSPEGLKAWQRAVQLAATAPGVTMKISGIGIHGKAWTLADQRPIIDTCIDAFGPDRCMFASNFPVDHIVGSFDDIFGGFLAATADLHGSHRAALFCETAKRIYRLELAGGA